MSIAIKIYNQKAEVVGDMKLSDKIFGVKSNNALVHQAMVTQMSNERQVLAHTKIRSEVRGGGRKPWKQKGTGRARAGSKSSPIWIGGGITFGPRKDRNFSKNINKKMKQKAMFIVLSDRATNNIAVIDKLNVEEFKTKILNEIMISLEKNVLAKKKEEIKNNNQEECKKEIKKQKRSVLVINSERCDKLKYSGRNLKGLRIINLDNINILDLLKYRNLVITVDAIKKLEKKY